MSKKLNNLCHWKPVPLSFIIYCNRCSCHLLLTRSVLKLPSHHDGGNLKPWRHLHGCCGYGARCSGSRTLLRGRRNLLQARSFPQTVSPYQLCASCSWWDTPDFARALCPSMAFLLSGSLVGVLYFFGIRCACCGKKKVTLRDCLKEFGLFLPCIWALRFYLPVIRNITFSSPQ